MRFRKLRIAWSVACGISCVLLCVLWVRSANHRMDVVTGKLLANRGFIFGSIYGEVEFEWMDRVRSPTLKWERRSMVMNLLKEPCYFPPVVATFRREVVPGFIRLSFPHWFLVLLSVCLGGIPWIRWRFSLRTLLIIITLVAVVLGTIEWLNHR
jgi:hypothetical protein